MTRKKGVPAKANGRPLAEIDWKIFEQLCHIQCTQSEIASFLHIHHETLITRVEKNYDDCFSSVYKKFAEGGKQSLRRMQWTQAEKSCAMAIWLGKQYLGQRDSFDDNQNTQQVRNVNIENELMKAQATISKLIIELEKLKSTQAEQQ
jgi:hypothetical protein